MSFWRRLRDRISGHADQDLNRELRAHLELEAEEQQESGLQPDEARYAAQRAFGNTVLVKEDTRTMWGWTSVEQLFQDLRYALRMLWRSPGFTTVAVLSLALGIGANVAVFSLVDAILLKALPIQHPEQLVAVTSQRGSNRRAELSYPLYREIRDRQDVFAGVVATARRGFVSVRLDQTSGFLDAGQVSGRIVSGNYFSVLGVNALLGRLFTPDDDRVPGGHPVAVISYGFWERHFAHDLDALTRTLYLNEVPFRIIGVTPRRFFGDSVGSAPDVWVPTMMQPTLSAGTSWLESRSSIWLQAMARLKPGVSVAQADAVLTNICRQAIEAGTASSGNRRISDYRVALEPASQGLGVVRRQFSQPLRLLMAVVGLVLLIACCNLASLLLARASARQREIGVRLAIGSSRFRLIRQLLTEGTLLSLLGGLFGVLLAAYSSKALVALASDPAVPLRLDLTPDWRLLAFTIVVSLLAGVLFSLVPAHQATAVDLAASLNASSRGQGDGRRKRMLDRSILVLQVAFSLVLWVGAGLLVRTLQNLRTLDAGVNRENVLLFEVIPDPATIGRFRPMPFHDLAGRMDERLNAIPGVRSASLSTFPLFTDQTNPRTAVVPGFAPPASDDGTVYQNSVTPRFFETMGMRLLHGRFFGPQDHHGSPRVVIINETTARAFFPNQNPVGQLLGFGASFRRENALEVVGVVKDAKYLNLREDYRRCVYMPEAQVGNPFFSVEVRTSGNPLAIIQPVQQVLKEVKRDIIIRSIRTLEEQIDRTLVQERMFARVCGSFALLALVLACVGLYGTMSYAVARRTSEIGIRMAVGARQVEMLWLILREALGLICLGVFLGLPAALAATRLLKSFLFGLNTTDPITLFIATAVIMGTGLLAAYLPARRASRVDPMVALRYE